MTKPSKVTKSDQVERADQELSKKTKCGPEKLSEEHLDQAAGGGRMTGTVKSVPDSDPGVMNPDMDF